ncbi:hypothetical protein [Arthrobacter sp. NA-172]|uniref:hypothetical protein n=1 Tax=Arthrobacter sp. NA-172 TaxID=3367524 RepID=UPI0037540B07
MNQDFQPQPDHVDAAAGLDVQPSPMTNAPVAGLTPHNAVRSRHWRFWLGLFELISGLFTATVFTVANTVAVNGQIQDLWSSGNRPEAGWIAAVVAIIVGFSVVSISGVLIGIWNLAAQKGTDRSPLIAAIVVSAASVVLAMVFIDGNLSDPANIGWVLVHVFVILWTIGILRLKKVSAP